MRTSTTTTASLKTPSTFGSWTTAGGIFRFDYDRINAFLWDGGVDWSNPHRTAGPWVAVLFYLMTDYRYLHL